MTSMPRSLLPSGSGRSSTPFLASSSICGAVHPVALDSSRLSSVAGTLVHPIVVAGGSSGSIAAKASAVLDVVGRIGSAAADGMTGC